MSFSTHVLDTSRGCPAAGVMVTLEQRDALGHWQLIGGDVTDRDGRIRALMPEEAAAATGEYRLTFATREYFQAAGIAALYPSVTVTVEAREGRAHYHVPLLLGPFGYTTYLGT